MHGHVLTKRKRKIRREKKGKIMKARKKDGHLLSHFYYDGNVIEI